MQGFPFLGVKIFNTFISTKDIKARSRQIKEKIEAMVDK